MTRILAVLSAACVAAGVASGQPVVSAVLNAASYSAAVAPGSWVAIFGTNLASAVAGADSVPLPASLAGVSVTVGGIAAPLLYVSPGQLNVLIPSGVVIPANTVVPLVVTSPGGVSSAYNVRLTRNAPGIFTRNGAGTGRALVFNPSFKAVDTIAAKDNLILYATGLGPTDASGKATDNVEVYIGERQAQVTFAGLAPGFPGVYQVNVTAPVPATDRLYIRAGGWQSNITDVGIRSGSNALNVTGSIDGLFPSSDPRLNLPPCVDELSPDPCGGAQTFSIMLHAGTFSVSFDIAPSASPFDVAAVGVAGASVISIDPAARTYNASVSTVTQAAAAGDFSMSVVPLWDYANCTQAVCFPFPGPSILPVTRFDPLWFRAIMQLPAPTATTATSPNAVMQVSGTASGSHFAVDGQTNSSLSRFGGIVQVPLGPFDKNVSTFKLYVDGNVVAAKDFTYSVVKR